MVRRIHRIVLLIALLIGGAGMNYMQAEVYSGTCGAAGNEANVTWAVDTESGVLSISGTGAMMDYNTTASLIGLKTPWRNYGTYVKTLIIGSGITHVGVAAFSLTCGSIKDVYVSWTGASIPTANMISLFTVKLHIPCGQSANYTNKNWINLYTLVEETHGTCGANGTNLIWALSCDNKTLTIRGTGAMVHYWAYEDIPWWNYRGSIQQLVIEKGVTTIGNHAFAVCSNLTSVYLPNTLTAISYLAFGHCTGLPSLVIPSSVTSLAGMFIHNTASLTDVYVSWTGDAVPEMPADLHPYDASQKRLHIPCGQEAAYTAKGWNTKFTYVTMSSGTCGTNVQWTLDHCTGVLTISGTGAMTDYQNESKVPWRSYRKFITSVVIQNGVTRIGDNTFYNCSNLTSITIPPSVMSIGTDAFFGCWAMESLYIADLAAWCNISFSTYDSSPFTRNGYSNYLGGGDLYVNGVHVTTLTIPNGITEIPNHTFSGFANITSIQFNQATSIGGFAFAGCHGLTHVTIPEGVTTIGNKAFAYCTNLQSISVPASVTSLGTYVLFNSLALTDIYVHWTENIPSWGYFTSKNPQSDITLHVPCGTAALYQAAEGWQDYTIVEDRAHGTCGANGDNLTWTLSCDGTLTISGTGAMYNWMTLADRPWHSLCTSIQRVVIEEGVTTTGYHAFYNAFNLTSVSLPSTLQTLQFMTFFGCGKLTTLTIPSSVTYVGDRSLEGCSALTDVYMSETGDAIPTMPVRIHTYDASRIRLHIPCGQAGTYIAKGWNNRFTLPGVVSGTCGDNVRWTFESCNGTLSIFGTGAMTDFESSADVPWYSYRSSIASVQIAEGVTSIGAYAFDYCTSLTSVSIPNSVTNIGRSAFYYCISLTSITIPNRVINISDFAFYYCSALSSVTIPNSVTSIGLMAFNTCTSLTSVIIPNSVTNLGKFTFMFCDLLTDIYVSWTSADAIPEWIRLTNNDPQSSITLHVPCGTTSLYQAADGWKDYRITDDIASGICGATGHESDVTWSLSCDGTLTIQGTGAMADWSSSDKVPWYSYRSSITTVNIRDGVTSVGNRAFIDCAVLTSVTIPNSVTSISNNAFFSCSALTGIAIPNSVTTIGQYVFYGCSALTNITIPGSVTSLGESIFKNCSALTDIYVSWIGTDILELPTNIHNSASEIKLHIPCGTAADYASKNWSTMFTLNESSVSGTCGANGDNLTWSLSCDGTLTIRGTGEMYNWMTLADRPWHSLCTSIQRVVIEEGVTTTGYHAFYNAFNLTSVSLPSTLQTLQFMTFFGCGKLTTLTIPSSVTYVGDRSLEGCSALTDVYMSETGDAIPTMPVRIHTYDASQIRLHIPCGQAVNYIAKGWNTMFTIDGVVSGTCGDNVRWTFESCNGTLSIFGTGEMADYELAQAPWDAYKYSITSVSIAEGVTSIGAYAFYYCTSMTSISLPNSLTSIGNFAFYSCGDLASVIIPNNVTNIGKYAFYYCTSLTSITIPNGVTSIKYDAFYHCTALSSVSIPSSVTSIESCAFTSCALTSVAIPNSVTSIDDYAFSKCNSLADIYVSWTSSETIPAWQNMTSNDPQSSITLHVPCSAMSLYKAAEGWKDYTIEGEGGPYTITVESDDPSMGTVDARKIEN